MTGLLTLLKIGDRLPWRLDEDGEPQWLTVIEVVGTGSYLVCYPDGTIEPLVDPA